MAPSQIKLAQNWPKAGVLDILDGNKSSYAHRAFASGAKGRPFESARAYHKINNLQTTPENRVRRRYALPKNPQPKSATQQLHWTLPKPILFSRSTGIGSRPRRILSSRAICCRRRSSTG